MSLRTMVDKLFPHFLDLLHRLIKQFHAARSGFPGLRVQPGGAGSRPPVIRQLEAPLGAKQAEGKRAAFAISEPDDVGDLELSNWSSALPLRFRGLEAKHGASFGARAAALRSRLRQTARVPRRPVRKSCAEQFAKLLR